MYILHGILFSLIVILLIIGIANEDKDDFSFGTFCRELGSILASFIMILLVIFSFTYNSSPNAIDVYRGRTELKIKQEIINNKVVKSDTIIVYKDEFKR